MLKKRQKRQGKSPFVKHLYIGNDEFWYRLEQGIEDASDVNQRLERYYARLNSLSDRYWSNIRFYLLIYGVAILSVSGIISKFSISGFEVDSSKLNFIIVPLIALCALDLTKLNSKKFALESIFIGHYKRSDCYGRARLLLSYPEAYSFDKFRLDHNLMPKFMLPASGYIQYIAFALLVILGGMCLILANFCLYFYCAYELWNQPSDIKIYGRIIVLLSTLAIFATAFVPQAALYKRKYSHFGLSVLFNNFHAERPDRWRYFVGKLPRE